MKLRLVKFTVTLAIVEVILHDGGRIILETV